MVAKIRQAVEVRIMKTDWDTIGRQPDIQFKTEPGGSSGCVCGKRVFRWPVRAPAAAMGIGIIAKAERSGHV